MVDKKRDNNREVIIPPAGSPDEGGPDTPLDPSIFNAVSNVSYAASLQTDQLCILQPSDWRRLKLGVSGLPEIIELRGDETVYRVEFDREVRDKFFNIFNEIRFKEEVGCLPEGKKTIETKLRDSAGGLPLVRSPKDERVAIFILEGNQEKIKKMHELMTKAGIELKIQISEPGTTLLTVNGVFQPVAQNYLSESQSDLSKTFSELPDTDMGKYMSYFIRHSTISSKRGSKYPRTGRCSYMVVDMEVFSHEEYRKDILDHLSILSQSNNFCFSFDQNGNLVIICLQERSGSHLYWAQNLRKLSEGTANVYFSKGKILVSNSDELVIDGYFTKNGSDFFHRKTRSNPALSMTQIIMKEAQGSRDTTLVEINPIMERDGFMSVEVDRRVLLNVGGGPDKLIGNEDESLKLRRVMSPLDPTKLIFVEGSAGFGKSKLVYESLLDFQNIIQISIDPAGRGGNSDDAEKSNIPGFSLVNFADQIALYIEKNVSPHLEKQPQAIRLLQTYVEKNESDKLMEANLTPDTVSIYCLEALRFLEQHLGSIGLVIDDVHHNDSYSDPIIMGIVREFLASKDNEDTDELPNEAPKTSKVLMMRRPEERYASISQENLKRDVSSFETISLNNEDGTSKLNLADPMIAKEYVLHSLPVEMRVNEHTGSRMVVGDWSIELAKDCVTPFQLTSYLNEIVSDTEGYLLRQGNEILLKEKGKRRLEAIKGLDMVDYHNERIKEQLSAEARLVLQTFAILGFKSQFSEFLEEFMAKVHGHSLEKTRDIFAQLVKSGYVTLDMKCVYNEENQVTEETINRYALWHDNIRDIVINETLDPMQRQELALKVYDAVADNPLVSDNHKFTILHYAAFKKDPADAKFWEEYSKYAVKSFDQAISGNLYARGFQASSMVLGGLHTDLGADPYQTSTLNQLVMDLEDGKDIPVHLRPLLLKAIYALAYNGCYLAEFKKTKRAIELAEDIAAAHPDWGIDLKSFWEVGFETSYLNKREKDKVKMYYHKLEGVATPRELDMRKARMLYAEQEFEKCKAIISKQGALEKLPLEMQRLVMRLNISDFTNIQKIDEDVKASGVGLDDKFRSQIRKITRDILSLQKRVRETRFLKGKSSEKLTPILDISIVLMLADTYALLGNYVEADKLMAEVWRQYMQNDMPSEAAFIAVRKGNIEIAAAIKSQMGKKPIGVFRKLMHKAINTYTQEGLDISQSIDDGGQSLGNLSGQRLRAICMLLDSFTEGDDYGEVLKLLDQGRDDIERLKNSVFMRYAPPKIVPTEHYEFCYYITPYMTYFRRLAEKHGHPYKRVARNAYEQEHCVLGAIEFAKTRLKSDLLGERDRKITYLQSRQKKK